jgi:hypothetical protein
VFRFRLGLGLIKVRINEDFILFESLVEVDFGSVLKLGCRDGCLFRRSQPERRLAKIKQFRISWLFCF